MPVTIPRSLQPLLQAYLTILANDLPGYMRAFYLHGSIALDDYQPPFSDIDFITVINRRSTPGDIKRLREIHRALQQQYPQSRLSGSYLQPSDLGRSADTIEPHPYTHDGTLHAAGYHDINAVTWWVLTTQGVALAGPDPRTIDYVMDWDRFIADTRENLNTYWVRFVREPARVAWLLGDGGIQWTVLGTLRQFYTFEERGITSKTGAGQYALEHLPERWHPIIQEALDVRVGRGGSRYRGRVSRSVDAFRFLRFIIDRCNAGSGAA
jgi:hypothetical protein